MLSVVAASRNDGHGLHLTARMQVFVDSLVDQVERFDREVELILVDWNPPPDQPGLDQILTARDVTGFVSRVIQVPPQVHNRLSSSTSLGFFQMIAKNVGIRRAHGDAILATNIDILLSDELFLDSTAAVPDRTLYRADRVDIPFDPEMTVDPEELRRSTPNRINRKTGIYYPDAGAGQRYIRGPRDLAKLALEDPVGFTRRAIRRRPGGQSRLSKYRDTLHSVFRMPQLHLNACGDFTLMSKRSWSELRGYPEWEVFSWRLDGILLFQAAAAGYAFKELSDHPAYHLDHSAGFSLEQQDDLFDRIRRRGIPALGDTDALEVERSIWEGRHDGRWLINLPRWGMEGVDFAENSLPVKSGVHRQN